MKVGRFSEVQIIRILKKFEAGRRTAELRWEQRISEVTFSKWKAKYGVLEVSETRRLEEEIAG